MMKTIKAIFLGLVSLAFVASAYADITFVSWGGAYTCLLYTSPSPRDLSTSRMQSSA